MTTGVIFLTYVGALLSVMAGAVVLWRDRRSPIHWIFAAGMAVLGLRETLIAIASGAASTQALLWWSGCALLAEAFLPGIWLIFSLSFGRAHYRAHIRRWRWVIGLTFLTLVALAITGQPDTAPSDFFAVPLDRDPSTWALIPLGRAGYLFYFVCLLTSLVILINLEGILRAAAGTKRQQIKFVVLGIGGVFASRIYIDSQALLFGFVEAAPDPVTTASVLSASLLTLLSLRRLGLLDIDLYLHVSPFLLHRSLAVSVVGLYLLIVGGAALVLSRQGGDQLLPMIPLLVFLAMMGGMATLLSSRVRQYARRQIARHLRPPAYDYRQEWRRFTECTTSILDVPGLCGAVTRMVSETFVTPSVTIWLMNEAQDHVILGGSTVLSRADGWRLSHAAREDWTRAILEQPIPVEFGQIQETAAYWPDGLRAAGLGPAFWSDSRYGVPLVGGRDAVLGVMLLGPRSTGEPLTVEDLDLLKTLADQVAGTLLNLRFSERLVRAKELEAFQTVSAFFVHDLKNLLSTLSLLAYNLPSHYDDPNFRTDALRAMSHGIERIDRMLSNLSQVSQSLALHTAETDLNDLVRTTLAEMNGSVKSALVCDLHSVPKLPLDSRQFQKILVNLLLNADEALNGRREAGAVEREASGEKEEVRVTTEQRNGAVVLSISDTGCGMSPTFVAQSLFQPFQTTKRRGLGIGLFHSKQIVEAHHGWFEVDSEEGKGTTFRVILPVGRR